MNLTLVTISSWRWLKTNDMCQGNKMTKSDSNKSLTYAERLMRCEGKHTFRCSFSVWYFSPSGVSMRPSKNRRIYIFFLSFSGPIIPFYFFFVVASFVSWETRSGCDKKNSRTSCLTILCMESQFILSHVFICAFHMHNYTQRHGIYNTMQIYIIIMFQTTSY